MKKYIFAFVLAMLTVMCLGTLTAQACVVPLDDSGNEIMVKNEQNVSMQYLGMEIRPGSGSSVYSLEVALKNNGADTEILVGLPKYFYSTLSDVTSVAVSCCGTAVKVTSVDATNNPAISNDPGFSSYYSWKVDAKNGETVYMNISFTASTRANPNGTQIIDVPLKALNCWAGDVGNVNIELYNFSLNVYSYENEPSIAPTKMYATGMLEWKLNNKEYTKNFTVYYSLDNNLIQKYFTNVYLSGDEKTASDLFKQRKYSDAVKLIEEKLNDVDDFRFLKMVCLEKLGNKDEANKILAEIYKKDVCFSTTDKFDISEYARKRMLYTYYMNLKNQSADKAVLETVLSEGTKTLSPSKSAMFLKWANDEQNRNDNKKEDDGKIDDPKGEQSGFSFKKWLSNMSEPLILTVGIVLMIVVVFCIMGLFASGKTKKKDKKHSMKR